MIYKLVAFALIIFILFLAYKNYTNCVNGTWDSKQGKCICSNGYTGDNCEVFQGGNSGCVNGYWNDDDNLCSCADGYTGTNCDERE